MKKNKRQFDKLLNEKMTYEELKKKTLIIF